MKKIYEAPSAELIKFNYRDQVVAASGVDLSTNCRLVQNGNSGNDKNNGNHYGQWRGDGPF